ncbi:hypothetical protein NEUTE1DRAFT_118724, partial [Neurospora tetrasperma FGSC 2508]
MDGFPETSQQIQIGIFDAISKPLYQHLFSFLSSFLLSFLASNCDLKRGSIDVLQTIEMAYGRRSSSLIRAIKN